MTQIASSPALKTMNFIVGIALLVMLFPVPGKTVEKPAGVRTAIEMISKKASLRASTTVQAASA